MEETQTNSTLHDYYRQMKVPSIFELNCVFQELGSLVADPTTNFLDNVTQWTRDRDALGQFDLRKRRIIQVDEIFDYLPGIRGIALSGVAGIGKSSLCRKIPHEWASGRLFQKKFDQVYWIPIRDLNHQVQNPQSPLYIDESFRKDAKLFLARVMAHHVLNEPSLETKFLEELQTQTEKKLLLMDGYDEGNSTLIELLKPLFNEGFYFLVTSRPGALDVKTAPFFLSVKSIGLIGISNLQILHFSERYFNDGERASKFVELIQRLPRIYSLAHIPLYLQNLWRVYEKNPNLKFELLGDPFGGLIDELIILSNEPPSSDSTVMNDDDDPPQFTTIKLMLGEMALEGFSSETQVISSGIVTRILEKYNQTEESLLKIGLLKSQKGGSSYQFLDFSFQEFLLAYYVSNQSEEWILKFIESNRRNTSYQLVMIFLSRQVFLGDSSKEKEWTQRFSQSLISGLESATGYQAHYLYELALGCFNECEEFCEKLTAWDSIPKSWMDEYSRRNPYSNSGVSFYEKAGALSLLDWLTDGGMIHCLKPVAERRTDQAGFRSSSPFTCAHWAIRRGLWMLRAVHRYDPDLLGIPTRTEDKLTVMDMASVLNRLEDMKWIHEWDPSILGKSSFVLEAAFNNNENLDMDILKWIYQENPDLFFNSMILAANQSNLELMKWIHSLDSSLLRIEELGGTALCVAATKGDLEMMQWIHDQDSSLLKGVVEIPYSSRDLGMLQWIYLVDPSLLLENSFRNTHLMRNSVIEGDLEIMEWLHQIDSSLIEQSSSKEGWTIMHDAIRSGYLEMMEWIHEQNPSFLEKSTFSGKSPMHVAAKGNQLSSMKWLYQKDPSLLGKPLNHDRNAKRSKDVDPSLLEIVPKKKDIVNVMIYAFRFGDLEMVQWIYDQDESLLRPLIIRKIAIATATRRRCGDMEQWVKTRKLEIKLLEHSDRCVQEN